MTPESYLIDEHFCKIVAAAITCGYLACNRGESLQQAIAEFRDEFIEKGKELHA